MDIENYIANLIKSNFYLWNLGLNLNSISVVPCCESIMLAVVNLNSHLVIDYLRFVDSFTIILYDSKFDEVKRKEKISPQNLSEDLSSFLQNVDNSNSVLSRTICFN